MKFFIESGIIPMLLGLMLLIPGIRDDSAFLIFMAGVEFGWGFKMAFDYFFFRALSSEKEESDNG